MKKDETKKYFDILKSLHECGCQISSVQIPQSELRCYKDTLSAQCFAYFKQSGNHTYSTAVVLIEKYDSYNIFSLFYQFS